MESGVTYKNTGPAPASAQAASGPTKFCGQCGAKREGTAKFCGQCGGKIE